MTEAARASLDDSPSRRSAQWVVVGALALVLVGLVVQLGITDPRAADVSSRPLRQLAYAAMAFLLGAAAFSFGYQRAVRLARPLLWLTWALLAVLLLPGMPTQYGAARWIDLGPVHLQPSELAKLTVILHLTAFASKKGQDLLSFRSGFLPAIFYVGITAALVRCEPDLGQTLFLLALSGAVLVANGLRVRHGLPVFAALAPLLIYHAIHVQEEGNYVQTRVARFLSGEDYQLRHGLRFLARGGFDGTGLDEGRAHLFVPKIHNDFVLVAVGETAGFIGAVTIVALFFFIFWHGIQVALRARTREGFSVAFGVSVMVALQAAVNIAVVTGSVPPKGISLPFLSFGGSSLLVLGVAIGLLVSVSMESTADAPSMASGQDAASSPRTQSVEMHGA